jgi:serine/threonine protein kinase
MGPLGCSPGRTITRLVTKVGSRQNSPRAPPTEPDLGDIDVETIGAFQIRKPLGRGVTGVVYEGYNPVRGVVAAVKVFTQVTNRTPALKSRLLRDAHAAAALHHPNLAGVLEVGEYQGRPFVVTECVEGMDLGQVLRSRKPFPVEWVLDLWRQMCEGLAFAHRSQLLHLDLKPTDVRVTPTGEVKLLDFGVQHLKSLERSNGPAVGGVHYRAPEQVEGKKPDTRADLFSAAAIVYELLARRRAFPGEDLTTVLMNITRGRPDPSALPYTAFSPGLEEIVLRSMARDPRERPESFEALHAELVTLVCDTRARIRAPAEAETPAEGVETSTPSETEAALERDRLLTELFRARSEDHMQRGLDICRRLLEMDPEDETARKAAREIEAVVQDREVEQLVGLALSYAADGDTELATKIAEKVERVAPWSPRYLQLQVYLDEVAARQTADRLVATARQALNYDRTEEARSAAEEALSLLPGHPAALRVLDELASPLPSPIPRYDPSTAETDPAFEDGLADAEPSDVEPSAVEDEPVALPELDSPTGPVPVVVPAPPAPEARQVESLTSAALRHFVGNDHGKARQAVEKALALDPGNRRALELQKILGALG